VLHPVKKGENGQKTLQLRFFHKFFWTIALKNNSNSIQLTNLDKVIFEV